MRLKTSILQVDKCIYVYSGELTSYSCMCGTWILPYLGESSAIQRFNNVLRLG
ncbi:hypothetical protein NHE_0360 [Neorickettsia helminthoeca str. Oregon]|uniref:Uncharacterized protein n=1 Tax=Neorickettsia helminthoeca str. Oregon TaxID=1286528 RepID=X5GW60_9RICK|nr:hypothetical protein NHE_0360 [Neorickettsia helminthoeca str. Oregon]